MAESYEMEECANVKVHLNKCFVKDYFPSFPVLKIWVTLSY